MIGGLVERETSLADRGRVIGKLALSGFAASMFALPGNAGVDKAASAFVLCKHQKSVRTIKVMPEHNDSCSITYSKGGVDQLVGTNRSLSTCKSILQSIKNNLESSKWNCRDVLAATVTTSSEVLSQ